MVKLTALIILFTKKEDCMRDLFIARVVHEESIPIPELGHGVSVSELESAVDEFWKDLEKEIEAKNYAYDRVKLYQDGWTGIGPIKEELIRRYNQLRISLGSHEEALRQIQGAEGYDTRVLIDFLEGRVSDRDFTRGVVRTVAEGGNKNYQLLEKLMGYGARLIETENRGSVVQEKYLTPEIAQANLVERDKYIANRINATLQKNEQGILFIGLRHDVVPYLAQDILE